MSDTLADLSLKVDFSGVDKAATSVEKLGAQTHTLTAEQQKLLTELTKATTSWTEYEKATSKVGSSLKDVAASFNPLTLAAGGLAGVLAGLSLDGLKGMVEGVISARASMYDLSKQTGITVEVLSGLKSIGMQTGTTMDEIAQLTTKFNAAVATSGRATSLQAQAFENLGIKTTDANGHFKDTITLQTEAAKVLNDHSDGIEKDAYYMALWGKGALQNREYLIQLGEQQDIHGKMTTAQAEQAHKLELQFMQLGKVTGELKNSLADALVPTLLDVTTKMNDVFKAAGGLNQALAPGMIDLMTMKQKDFANALRLTTEELKGLGTETHWYNLWLPESKDFLDAKTQQLQNRIQTLKNLIGQGDEAAAKARKSFAENDPRRTDGGGKETLANLKDKEVAQVKGPSLYDATPQYEQQAASLIKLRDELAKYAGVQQFSNLQVVQADIELGKYNQKVDANGKVTREAATSKQKAQLLSNAADLDSMQMLVAKTKAENAAWDAAEKTAQAEQAKVTALRATITQQGIAIQVNKTYGATQDDVNIAITNHNIAEAELAVNIAKATGATDQEVYALQAKVDALRETKGLQQDLKDQDDAEIARQRTFSAGWDKAFNDYQKKATDSATQVGAAFQSVTGHMSDAFANFVTTGKLDFKGLASSILGDLAKIAAEKAIAGIAASLFSKGAAFSGGVQMYATGGVVSSPTAFGMSGGQMGVMGEAGPEAVMPLSRNADGKLGIKMAGGGGGSTNVANNTVVNITMNGDAGNVQDRSTLANQVKQVVDTQIALRMRDALRSGGQLNPLK